MSLGRDERGVAPLIGLILVFGAVIILVSVWQAEVIPAENAGIELDHYSEVTDDMTELRSAQINAGQRGGTRSTAIQLGTAYPSRVLFLNPLPPSGQFRTTRVGNGTIRASAVDLGTVCGTDSEVTTQAVQYEPNYNYHSDVETPPLVLENTVLYQNLSDSDPNRRSEQAIIQGGTVSLYPITNNVSKSGGRSIPVEFEGASTGTDTVEGGFNLSIPTALTAEQWAEMLPESSVDDTVQLSPDRVKFVLTDQSWEIECSAIGVGESADVTPSQQPGTDPSPQSGGVGLGGVSQYSETNATEKFSVANGRWENITCTDQLVLSNGQPADKPEADDLNDGAIVRLSANLLDSAGEEYTIDTKLVRDRSDGSWGTRSVEITDGDGNNANADLKPEAAKRIYEGGQTDLLEPSNYDDPDTGQGSFTDYVDRIQRLDDDQPVTWQTTRMTGRVDVTLECDAPPAPPASGVVTVDGTTPESERSALLFDLQVAADTTKTVTAIDITKPGNQNEIGDDVEKIKRTGNNPEVRLSPSNTDGVNQSGELSQNVKIDGTEYDLDTDAVFSDGAVLSVDIGDIESGGVKLTYHKTSMSNADVTVTFKFQDGTQHQTHLRVTNVNS